MSRLASRSEQLGRYRLDSVDEDDKRGSGLSVNEPSSKKKSVRFHEHDPREDWQKEKRAKTDVAGLHRDDAGDWLLLAILGIGMALTSMLMDNVIEYLQTFQLVLMNQSGQTGNSYLDYFCTYLSWIGYTQLLVICSATFVHYVAPQAIGSGIPEMKTILRGVILKDYLTFRTLISKIVGLTFSLGSGIPIGKMGPFVHLASIAGNLLSNLAANFDGAYGNECRKSEMLAAACAVGVACTFSAPIGGVLFSIEVTTMYFSVRNYWRGFFAAACGATIFRLLRVVVFEAEVTLVGFYQTHFPQNGFEPEELIFFAMIGVFCGLMGAVYIIFYQSVVMFLRNNRLAKRFFQNNWIVYPITVTFLVASITYPRGYGRFLTGRYKFAQTVVDLFSNCTWSKPMLSPESPHGCSAELLASWTNHEGYGPYSVFLVLSLFTLTFLFLAALCATMPIPCGMFMPTFVVGAGFGRLIGEIVAVIFPEGMPGGTDQPIFPGIYAVVGAAALTGAITHSVSVAMICCEITGQLIYIIPLMVAVIIANAVCAYLQPSIYDCVIRIKHLPYLPDIPPSNSAVHMVTAEHVMVSPVRYLSRLTTFADIRNILVDLPKLRSFPVVDDPSSMMLLGSIPRRTLLEMLSKQIGDDARKAEAERRIRIAIETIDMHFREAQRKESKPNMDDRDSRDNSRKVSRAEFSDAPIKKKSFVIPAITRAHSESAIENTQELIRQRYASGGGGGNGVGNGNGASNGNGSVDLSDHPIQIEAKPRHRSRFTIEPVTLMNGKNGKKRSRSNPRRTVSRRNAFSSVSVQGRMSEDEGTSDQSRPNSGGNSPTRKGSWADGWPTYDHQASITRNIAEYVKQARKRLNYIKVRHKEADKLEYDLFEDERRDWELERLEEIIELDDKMIDPAPFQLVRRTSLYKVHSLFSLLDLNRAYVTERGRLVGVVALRDLRIAIEKAQNGLPLKKDEPSSIEPLTTVDFGSDPEKGIANGSVDHSTMPEDVAQSFKEEIDRKRSQYSADESVHDVLTPPLKIVHPSSASLHHFHNHPMLTMIQEEQEHQHSLSRKSSLKSPNSTTSRQSDEARPSILPTASEAESSSAPTEVAQAVAYLRRKSLAPEELESLEETLPPKV
ncbi:CRE-CLH-3 protein [Aphelenchoides avenae]|nr:CRE-CLH-3 protein [Aphelenchus avenae]